MINKDNNSISELKKNIDIVQVIGQYLNLQKRGNNYWAICPFHSDTRPSLSISPSKQLFNCFSCNTKGDVFNFVQNYKNISYSKAILDVCDSLNIKTDLINKFKNKNIYDEESEKYYQINSLALSYFKLSLSNKNAQLANEYLKKRKLTKNLIDYFDIGCALDKNNDLCDALLEINNPDLSISMTDLKNVGLAVRNQEKTNFFINRIIFPIHDEYDNVVGFSGRSFVHSDNKEIAKYKNTETTKIFKKDQIFYNYNRVKKINTSHKKIFLCEGYMDVIALHSIDISNAIALMGLNLSDYHIQLLHKLKNFDEIIIALDNDEAGKQAAIKCAKKLLNANFIVSLFKYPKNQKAKDLDELINKNNFTYQNFSDLKIDYFEYLIDEAKNSINSQASINDLINVVENILKEIKTYANRVTWNKYIALLSITFELSIDDLKAKFDQISSFKEVDDKFIKQNYQIEQNENQSYSQEKNYLLNRIKNNAIIYRNKMISLEARLVALFYMHKQALIDFNNLPSIEKVDDFFKTICIKLNNLYVTYDKIPFNIFISLLNELSNDNNTVDNAFFSKFKEIILLIVRNEKDFSIYDFKFMKNQIAKLYEDCNLFYLNSNYYKNYSLYNSKEYLSIFSKKQNEIIKKNKEFWEKIIYFNK